MAERSSPRPRGKLLGYQMLSECMLNLLQTVIRDLEQSVRLLVDQVKYLTMNVSPSGQLNVGQVQRGSPASHPGPIQGSLSQVLRQPHLPPMSQQPSSSYAPQPFPQQQQQQPPHGTWFGPTNIAAPQASHPAAPPPVPQAVSHTPPLGQSEEWDDTYLAVLGSQDSRQLRELLARSNPEIVMPSSGSGPLSQAVVLTLVHRVSIFSCKYRTLYSYHATAVSNHWRNASD
jgi:hypothetical protein